MTTHDLAVNGNSAPRANQHDFAWSNALSFDFDKVPISKHTCHFWQEIEHILDRAPATTNRQPFKDLGRKDERCNDQSGEGLTNGQSRNEGNGHRELHRHPALNDVLDRFLEDRVTANQRGGKSNHTNPMKWLPQVEPDGGGGESNEKDTCQVQPIEAMLVVVIRIVVRNVRIRSRMLKRGRLTRMFCDGVHVCLLRGIPGRKHGSFEVA